MVNNKIWVLLGKKMAGEATDEDLVELDFLLQQESPEFSQNIFSLEHIIQLPTTNAEADPGDKSWDRLSSNMLLHSATSNTDEETLVPVFDEVNPVKRNKNRFLITVSIVLVFFIGALTVHKLWFSNQVEAFTLNEVITKRGSKTNILLPDGSKVWLNAGSKITYKKDFLQNREIELLGEAFFDVAHDDKKTFIIHSKGVNIKVLGTAFNVKAYPEDNTVETSLIRGLIELNTENDPGRKFLLKPNEKLTITKKVATTAQSKSEVENAEEDQQLINNLYSISSVEFNEQDSLAEDVLWIENKMIFKSEPFDLLSKRMERWYDVSFVFEDPATKKIKFTGVFDGQNIEQALKALQFSCNFKFDYNVLKNQVNIKSNKR